MELKPSAAFNEQGRKDLTAQDIRFTTKGQTLYAFVMGWPQNQTVVQSLAGVKVLNVEMLGFHGKLDWSQAEDGVRVRMPAVQPSKYAVALKIALA